MNDKNKIAASLLAICRFSVKHSNSIGLQRYIFKKTFSLVRYLAPNDYTRKDPLEYVHLNPNNINKKYYSSSFKVGTVTSGDWDKKAVEFDTEGLADSILAVKNHDVAIEETKGYKNHLEKINNGVRPRRFESKENLINSFQTLLSLYDEISKNGYKTQVNMYNSNKKEKENLHYMNEITVNIGRNGEFILGRSGNHRTTVLQALEINSVPVLVQTRHSEWERTRKAMLDNHSDGKSDESIVHPDLKNNISENVESY